MAPSGSLANSELQLLFECVKLVPKVPARGNEASGVDCAAIHVSALLLKDTLCLVSI